MSADQFDLATLNRLVELAKTLKPPIKPWTNPDTGHECYFVDVHPARIAALPARTRWRIEQHARRHKRRYGFALLPESVIVELAAQLDEAAATPSSPHYL